MKHKNICPGCNGRKIIDGNCECNMEWRSSEEDNGYNDCRCEPDQKCPTCSGTGFID